MPKRRENGERAIRRLRAGTTSCAVELLEPRALFAADMKFAVIGDFSSDVQTTPERDVANLVASWNPAFVATVGDNNYPDGAASTIDGNIGRYYHNYIYPYKGTYGAGAADGTNHFWPSLGNHDWGTGTASPYLSYFTLPGNGRYYSVTRGNVALFVVDSDPHEPDGTSATSVQGQWLQAQLGASTAKWKLVIFHHAAYSSGSDIGSSTWMRWPFAQWGASAVLSGHEHEYERLTENGIPYFVDGLGGESIVNFGSPISGSQVRYNGDYGAMLIDATDTALNFQFITRTGKMVDNYTLGPPALPVAPTQLLATASASTQVNLAWINGAGTAASTLIERSTDGVNFAQIGTAPTGATTLIDSGLAPATGYTYRVRASNAAGQSSYSNLARVTTLSAAPVTYLSSLAWTSATTGWGTVGRDVTVKGNAISLRGVTYAKGLGTHAVSNITFTLGGQYANFISDVGVDDEVAASGSVDFKVTGDGKVLYDSGVLTSASPAVSLNVSVAGVQSLTLTTTNGVAGTIDYDHADWAGARLVAATGTSPTPTPPAAPSGLVATALSASQINLAWTNNSASQTAIKIDRSTDGVTFTTITTNVAPTATTYADASGLVAGKTYYYRVRAMNAAGDSTNSNVASATTPALVGGVTYVSDLGWTSASIGWGSIHKDASVAGNPITLRGVTYAKGIGTHAPSNITYNLAGQYATFQSDVGVDDEENAKGVGSVIFQVIGDGKVLFNSGVLTNASPIVSISVSVAGVQQLTLVAINGVSGTIDYDHADWAGARLTL